MSDDTDDWMNPPPRPSMTWKDDSAEKPWLIMRERQSSWPPGATEWAEWSRFATMKDRDAAFIKLVADHPRWHLKKSHYEPWRVYG